MPVALLLSSLPTLDLEELFLFECTRKVTNDRAVSLNGRLFEVEAVLVGERVTLRHDPSRPDAPVNVWHDGRFIEKAHLVDTCANCHVRRHRRSGVIDADTGHAATHARLSMRAFTSDDTGNGTEKPDAEEVC